MRLNWAIIFLKGLFAVFVLNGVFALDCATLSAVETISFNRDEKQQSITGRLIEKAEDGGLMLQTPDGKMWTIQPEELIKLDRNGEPFVPLKAAELKTQMMAELPKGFQVHTTAHYVIMFNTTRAYAQWCGGMLERLYSAFNTYWTKLGFKLHEPEFPLPVIVFADAESYNEFTKAELKGDARTILAFYSLATNRISFFDLTGVNALRKPGDQRGSTEQINVMLSRPEAQTMVSNVIHEATHQIAFNTGLHQRFADIPHWVSEGIAVYFEAPDLKGNGWRTIGTVNQPRLRQFREFLPKRPTNSFETLMMDNKRFVTPKDALDAYAESWALNHYLMKRKPKEYVEYLKKLSEKRPFIWDEPETRLKEFKENVGDPDQIQKELFKYVQKLK